jgi:hypothetical protein
MSFWSMLQRKKSVKGTSRIKALEKRSKKLCRKNNILEIYESLVGASFLHGDFDSPEEDVEDSIDWMDVYQNSEDERQKLHDESKGNKQKGSSKKRRPSIVATVSIRETSDEPVNPVVQDKISENSLNSDLLLISNELNISCNKLGEKYVNQTLWYSKEHLEGDRDDKSSDRSMGNRTRTSTTNTMPRPPSILIKGKKGSEKLSSSVFQRIDKIVNELPAPQSKQLQRKLPRDFFFIKHNFISYDDEEVKDVTIDIYGSKCRSSETLSREEYPSERSSCFDDNVNSYCLSVH